MSIPLTKQEYRQGQRRLRDWLPWAKAEATKRPEDRLQAQSLLGQATFSRLEPDMLDALVIYEAPLGGYHCDLLFRNMPKGYPNAVGSVVDHPHATREIAEKAGKGFLVAMLRMMMQPRPPADPVFHLYDCAFPLLPKLFDECLTAMPQGAGGPNGGYINEDRAYSRIEDWLSANVPDGFTYEKFHAVAREHQIMLLSILHTAALTGVFRYPPKAYAPASPPSATEQRDG